MPFFSVIVPVYNAEGYLERCIESIKKQDFRDYEVIFIDDASQDSSPEICREVCNTDKRFRYYLKSHRGAAASRNYGMRRSVGNYIVFVDADDEWTVYTEDGSLSAQWEHTLLVTEDGVEIISK